MLGIIFNGGTASSLLLLITFAGTLLSIPLVIIVLNHMRDLTIKRRK